mgnify:CR=1 FL=1
MKRIILFSVVFFATNLSFSQNHFVTTWRTTTPNETVIIPTIGAGYNYDIDWENEIIDWLY